MISDRPHPLPECALCGVPTRRRVYHANRGMCTACRHEYDRQPRAVQQTLLLELEPPRPDLSNVVVLDTRRPR